MRVDSDIRMRPGGFFTQLFEIIEKCQWRREQAKWDNYMASTNDFSSLEHRENELDRRLGGNSFRSN